MSDPIVIVQVQPQNVSITESNNNVLIQAPGPQGATGPQGPPGAAGGEIFEFTQASPATPWVINHTLDTDYPDVTCIVSNEEVYPDVAYAPGIVTLTFGQPRAGTAKLRP